MQILKIAGGLLMTGALSWAGLIGSPVTGSMQVGGVDPNYYIAANGFVPVGFLNTGAGPTVTIADPAIEFGYDDGVNRDITDFTDTQLIFSDLSFSGHSISVTFSFTDSSFTTLSLVSTTFTGLTSGISGNTITFSFPDFTGTAGATQTAIFDINAVTPIPEPGAFGLLVLGFATLTLLGLLRKRTA